MTYRSGPEEWRNPADPGGPTAPPGIGEPSLPGDETVPAWVMASIGLGLVALTGSVVVISLAATAIVLGWLVRSAGPDDGVNRIGLNGPYGPLGGAGL